MTEGCVFCKIARGEIPSEKIYESENFFVIRDINPKTEGHSLVISKKHFDNFLEVPEELFEELLATARKALDILIKETGSTGYNLIINGKSDGGQLVPHFHLHILPRKENDGFKVSV